MIKSFEGLGDGDKKTSILEPYRDPSGIWTIGYGNTYMNGKPVTAKTKPITKQQAEELLAQSLPEYEAIVNRVISANINQNQFDALVSFCFNLGSLLKLKDKVNTATITREDFLLYIYSKGKVLKGLINRRNKEADYYFS